MIKIRKYLVGALATSLFVMPLISCAKNKNKEQDEEKENKKNNDIKDLLSEKVQSLQKNISKINFTNYKSIINDLKLEKVKITKFNELKSNVEQQLELIKQANDLLESHLPNLKVKFNINHFHKFKKDFKYEDKLIIKPFQEFNSSNISDDIYVKDIDTKIESEIFKLQTHTLTIENFLKGAYNTLLNNDQFNPLDDWQKASLDREVFEYYKPILNKKGKDLIKELRTLLEKSMEKKLDELSYLDLWDLFKTPGFKDLERGKEKYILDIYSKNSLGPDEFNYDETSQNNGHKNKLGQSYNREHLIAQSFFHKEEPMVFDAHHMFPTDSWTNAVRGDYDYGVVVKESKKHGHFKHFANNSKMGLDKKGQKVFEPDDAFKGDIARSYLYFAIRYSENIVNFKDGSCFTVNFPFIKEYRLNDFLDWHENIDLVNMYDLNRNKEIFTRQNNRNPFIDIPYLSKWIWDENYQEVPLTFLEK